MRAYTGATCDSSLLVQAAARRDKLVAAKDCGEAERELFRRAAPEGRELSVSKVCALSDLDNISIRVADVAARLAVLWDRRRDELRSSTRP